MKKQKLEEINSLEEVQIEFFNVRMSIRDLLKVIPDDARIGRAFRAAVEYAYTGERAELNNTDPLELVIFQMLAGWVNEAKQAMWDAKKNGQKGGFTPSKGGFTPSKGTLTDIDKDIDSDKEKDSEENKGQRICTEPSKLASMQEPSPVVFRLILKDGNTYGINEDEVDFYAAKYPGVDVEQAFRSMTGWLDSNPSKRKTRQGMSAFITHWLEDAQDRAVDRAVFHE